MAMTEAGTVRDPRPNKGKTETICMRLANTLTRIHAFPFYEKRLMGWIQSKIPDVPITNFTNDWNDGRAVGALVDACAPGKISISTEIQ